MGAIYINYIDRFRKAYDFRLLAAYLKYLREGK